MARDVERDRIVRELRRMSVPGDPMERAANYIQNMPAAGGVAPPIQNVQQGLRDLHQAARDGSRIQQSASVPPDHAVRDMLTRTTLNMLGEERSREIATSESRSDSEYIQWLMDVSGGEYRHIAHLISLTARFAGELPHELISTHARERIKSKVESSQYVRYEHQIREVEKVIYDLVHQQQYPAIINHPENVVVTDLIPMIDKLMNDAWESGVGQVITAYTQYDNKSPISDQLGTIALVGGGLLTILNNAFPIAPQQNYEAALRSWWVHTRTPQLQKEALFNLLATKRPEFAFLKHFLRRTVQAWTVLVDPGLAGNARMACSDIAAHNPRLRGITMEHVIKCSKKLVHDNNEHDCMFLDFFCGAVAARWRANSVFAAQPYKTRNEQNAVAQALLHSNLRLHEFAIIDDQIKHNPRKPPSTLAELRNQQFPRFTDSYII